jgi:hypothetical protein
LNLDAFARLCPAEDAQLLVSLQHRMVGEQGMQSHLWQRTAWQSQRINRQQR